MRSVGRCVTKQISWSLVGWSVAGHQLVSGQLVSGWVGWSVGQFISWSVILLNSKSVSGPSVSCPIIGQSVGWSASQLAGWWAFSQSVVGQLVGHCLVVSGWVGRSFGQFATRPVSQGQLVGPWVVVW